MSPKGEISLHISPLILWIKYLALVNPFQAHPVLGNINSILQIIEAEGRCFAIPQTIICDLLLCLSSVKYTHCSFFFNEL